MGTVVELLTENDVLALYEIELSRQKDLENNIKTMKQNLVNSKLKSEKLKRFLEASGVEI